LRTSLDLLLFSAFPELHSGVFVASSFRLLFISKKTPYALGAYTKPYCAITSSSRDKGKTILLPHDPLRKPTATRDFSLAAL